MECNKVKYKDKLSAMYALARVQRKGCYNPNHNECKIYYCKECGAYHLSSNRFYDKLKKNRRLWS